MVQKNKAEKTLKTLQPVTRATLSEQVALQIVEMISAGRWKTGQRLPSEAELCQSLGVGRSTLREALKSLVFLGMVKTRAGEGTFVANGPTKFLNQSFPRGLRNTEKDVRDLAETRIALEMELAGLCAQRGEEEDFSGLKHLVSEMQQSLDTGGENFARLDVDFHLAIAKGSQNQILAQLLSTIRDLLKEYIVESLRVPGAAEMAHAQHVKIFKALKERSSQRARTAMRCHLQHFVRSYAILLKTTEPVPRVEEASASQSR